MRLRQAMDHSCTAALATLLLRGTALLSQSVHSALFVTAQFFDLTGGSYVTCWNHRSVGNAFSHPVSTKVCYVHDNRRTFQLTFPPEIIFHLSLHRRPTCAQRLISHSLKIIKLLRENKSIFERELIIKKKKIKQKVLTFSTLRLSQPV